MVSVRVSDSSMPESTSTNRGAHKFVKKAIFAWPQKLIESRYIHVPAHMNIVCWKLHVPVSFSLSSYEYRATDTLTSHSGKKVMRLSS